MAAPISKVGLAAVAAGGAVAYTLASASFYTISSGSKVSQRGTPAKCACLFPCQFLTIIF